MEDVKAIKQVIERAYIQGIQNLQDREMVAGGFHPDFAMLVRRDGELGKVTVDAWLERINKAQEENPALQNVETTCSFKLVDATDYAAVAKLDVYKDDKLFATDYMLLYRFDEGWRIVSKVFAFPQSA